MRKKARKEEHRAEKENENEEVEGVTSRLQSGRLKEEEDEGRSERRQQAPLMELLCFECRITETHRESLWKHITAHHRCRHAQKHTLWMHKQTSSQSRSFKSLFCK